MQYIINNSSMILFLDNKPIKISKDSRQYTQVIEKLDLPQEQQEAAIRAILEPISGVGEKNGFKISADSVSYKGENLPQVLADKVRSIFTDGLPLSLFENFWNNLQNNPSASSVRELYDFLAYKELPITEDGCFLAYKGLDKNMWSISGNKETKVTKGKVSLEGKILNTVGAEIEVQRRDVDDNRENHCSFGLHVGSLAYAESFARGTVVVVKVNPKDVVSVPSDYNCQKCRVSAYKVVSIFKQEITDSVVDEDGERIEDECSKEHIKFLDRIDKYISEQCRKGLSVLPIRKIQNIFSPQYPSQQRVLNALSELGYSWNRNNDGAYFIEFYNSCSGDGCDGCDDGCDGCCDNDDNDYDY